MIDLRSVVAVYGCRRIDKRLKQIWLDVVNISGISINAVDDVFHMRSVQSENPVLYKCIRIKVSFPRVNVARRVHKASEAISTISSRRSREYRSHMISY